MITINKNDPIPTNAVKVEETDSGYNVTLSTDPEGQAFILKGLKFQANMLIRQRYQQAVKAGFQSGGFSYSSDPEDLQDLNNAVMSGVNQEFKTLDGALRQYTPPQIKQVLIDATSWKLNLVKKRDAQHDAISAAASEAEINAIVNG